MIFEELLEDIEDWPDPIELAVYGASINLTGLYSNIPIKCFWDEKSESWFDEDGMFKISKLGMVKDVGRVTFSSSLKKDVENWILGVRATTLLLRDWADFDCLKCGKPVVENGKNFCIFCEATKRHGDINLKQIEEDKNEGPDDNSI